MGCLLLLLRLLLLLLLLGLLLDYPVRASVGKVVMVTTCKADSSIDYWCLSCLLALRGRE